MAQFLRPSWLALLATALLAAACSGSDGAAEVPTTPPSINPGAVASGLVEIDGTSISYVAFVPEGFTTGDEAPLLLAFPPGDQSLGSTSSWTSETYVPEAQRLGWVVVSPAAPGGELYFQGSERLVPGFLDWVESWVRPEGGAPHVAGVSNGGLSAFRFAAENPDRLKSLVAYPGFPSSGGDRNALSEFSDIPVRMYVGGDDPAWISPAREAADELVKLGANVQLIVYPGEGHVITSTRDGAVIFRELESFRSSSG